MINRYLLPNINVDGNMIGPLEDFYASRDIGR